MLQLSLDPHVLHFRTPAATSRGALRARALWLVHAWDSELPEVRGRGEAALLPGLSRDDSPQWNQACQDFVNVFNRLEVTLPARDDDALADVTALLSGFQSNLARLPSLRFGIECALLDLVQGGTGVYFPSRFTRGAHGLPTHGLIWMDSAEGILRQVDAKLSAGFSVLKMKVGTLPITDEIALLKDIRRRAPDVELRLDANGAFPYAQAREFLRALADLNVSYLEEPLAFAEHEALASLIAESPIAIGLDETLLRSPPGADPGILLDRVGPQHIILKPALLGGFAPVLAWIAVADARGIAWWMNSLLESAIGHSAICQFTGYLHDVRGDTRVHGLGTGSLFADNFASTIELRGSTLWRIASA